MTLVEGRRVRSPYVAYPLGTRYDSLSKFQGTICYSMQVSVEIDGIHGGDCHYVVIPE